VVEVLLTDPWPGNVRELESVARYAAALADPGEPITVDHLPPELLRRCHDRALLGRRPTADELRAALDAANGNKTELARRLGLSRRTIQRRINDRRE
jgi:transcriptional regulator of acetoin/glycerol metabolism